jgi:RNA polymerase sigma-70 factor, ECF subfamily
VAAEPDIKGDMNPSEEARPSAARRQTASGTPTPEAEARFDACFRAHYADILAYALRRLGERGAAEDVTAQTFAVAWRRLSSLPADPLPWLYGVARQTVRNETRSARRRSRLLARMRSEDALRAARDPVEPVSERSAIVTALGHLGKGQREVLRLAAWEGMDARRAAAALGCSPAAYTLRLHRARRRLAKELAASGHVCEEDESGALTELVRKEAG